MEKEKQLASFCSTYKLKSHSWSGIRLLTHVINTFRCEHEPLTYTASLIKKLLPGNAYFNSFLHHRNSDYSIAVVLKQNDKTMQVSSMKNKTSFVTPANLVLSIVKRAQSRSGFTLIYQVGLNSSRSVVQKKKDYCKLCRAVFVSSKEQKKTHYAE